MHLHVSSKVNADLQYSIQQADTVKKKQASW